MRISILTIVAVCSVPLWSATLVQSEVGDIARFETYAAVKFYDDQAPHLVAVRDSYEQKMAYQRFLRPRPSKGHDPMGKIKTLMMKDV